MHTLPSELIFMSRRVGKGVVLGANHIFCHKNSKGFYKMCMCTVYYVQCTLFPPVAEIRAGRQFL
jgi:hypothetical protein